MFVSMILGQVQNLATWSQKLSHQAQLKEILVNTRVHIFEVIIMNLAQNVCLDVYFIVQWLKFFCLSRFLSNYWGRPRWLSWMRRPTGDQEVAGSTPAEIGSILSWRLIIKYFLRSFSPFRWFKKGSCQFLAKECAQYWLTA